MDEAWRGAPHAALGVRMEDDRLDVEPNATARACGASHGVDLDD